MEEKKRWLQQSRQPASYSQSWQPEGLISKILNFRFYKRKGLENSIQQNLDRVGFNEMIFIHPCLKLFWFDFWLLIIFYLGPRKQGVDSAVFLYVCGCLLLHCCLHIDISDDINGYQMMKKLHGLFRSTFSKERYFSHISSYASFDFLYLAIHNDRAHNIYQMVKTHLD